MLAKERHAIIMELLYKDKIVKISDITQQFHVSNETARRDLEALQDLNLVKRVYGGAILVEESDPHSPQHADSISLHLPRAHQRRGQKASIGKAAAALIHPGETVILDIGTTTLEIARHLKDLSGVTVLTNSLPIMNELAGSKVTVYCLGGKLNSDELSMHGTITLNALSQFFVDRVFISAGGVTPEGGISDYNSEEALVRQTLLRRTNQAVLVADSSKFGINAFAYVCDFDDIDVVISDENLPPQFRNALEHRSDLQLILAPCTDGEIDEDADT